MTTKFGDFPPLTLVLLAGCLVAQVAIAAKLESQFGVALNNVEDDHTYGVIVDCGSSGTRAHIYQWDSDLDYPELLQDIEPMRAANGDKRTIKINEPLASYEDRQEKVGDYIKPLMDYLAETIPKSRHSFTAVYVLATAGMRLLDEQAQANIMANVKTYTEANYNFREVKTKVISGAVEGMYQWIGVNSKAKRFLEQETRNKKAKTLAVIEMGGASIQVTYHLHNWMLPRVLNLIPKELHQVYKEQIVEPAISREDDSEHSYHLHSTTFLGFGSNSARDAYVDLLIKEQEKKRALKLVRNLFFRFWKASFGPKTHEDGTHMVIKDPCLPLGYTSPILKKPTRMLYVKDQTIGFTSEDDEPEFKFKLFGSGDYEKCRQLVVKMLEIAVKERLNCKPKESCTMRLLETDFVPFTRFDFLGIGDIYHTTNVMLELAGIYDHSAIVDKTKLICGTPYDVLKDMYPKLYDESRYHLECFKAIWVDTFLTRGLKMKSDFSGLVTTNNINRESLDWTLGAVLDNSLAIEKATEIENSSAAQVPIGSN